MRNRRLAGLAFILLLAMLLGMAAPACAAATPSIRGTKVLWIGTGKNAVLLDNLPEDAKSFKIKSSKTSVIKVGKDSNDAFGMWMKPLKAGKSKITVTYKSGGKTQTIKATYEAKKYPNPFAWIKVDGKKLNVKKDLVFSEVSGIDAKKVAVNYKLNSGWEKAGLTGMRFKADGNKPFTWKKNKAVSFSGAGTLVFSILLKQTKTGDEFEYLIVVNHK